MSKIRDEYDRYMREQEEVIKDPHGNLWNDQETRYIHPFKMYGDMYYVGCNWICMHLIDTGDGLLLFDAGNYGSDAMLVQAIWEAGFNPADVKWMVLSHLHLDHIGAVNFFRHMYGTKIYLGAPDAENLREHPELAYVQDAHNPMYKLFPVDVEIHDHETIKFGNLSVDFRLCPGHTDGVIAAFFDLTENGKTLRAGYYGGFGFNTLQRDYLLDIGRDVKQSREIYLHSLESVWDEHVDIFMGNHINNNNILEKRKRQLADPSVNPYIDPTEWKKYLQSKHKDMLALMEKEKDL